MIKKLAKNILNRLGYEVNKTGSLGIADNYSSTYLSRICQPQTVVDVGVGYGAFALYEAFPKAYFVLIEPLREYEKSMKTILAKYEGEVHYKAAANKEGFLEINVDKANLQLSSFSDRTTLTKSGNVLEKRKVEITTLDTIFQRSCSMKGPILLKLDTEGGELSVLEGAKLLLRSTDCVITEVSNC